MPNIFSLVARIHPAVVAIFGVASLGGCQSDRSDQQDTVDASAIRAEID